jgi:histidinol dehydrogenase
MKQIILPRKEDWSYLVERPTLNKKELTKDVQTIIETVRNEGDTALIKFAEKFDGVQLNSLLVTKKEIEVANSAVSKELKDAINIAKQNIEKFHKSQQFDEPIVETTAGVKCWRKSVAIDKVGLYIPGGSAPLFSTILMLGIPAKIAGCKEIILCTPPNKDGAIHPAILYTANLLGVTTVIKAGGAQAIAAMALGTKSVSRVNKIFAPGNQYVTKAKELIQQEGIAIDMPAGPSEVLIIADKTCNPSFVAADLLSQAEHGEDSQVILLTDNSDVVTEVELELKKQINKLPRKNIAIKALENSKIIQLANLKDCFEFSNNYAPEHLIFATQNANECIDKVRNAGSVFLGNYSCESAGDYASGTNHTLPTNGYAKSYSGVSLDSFVKKITFQELSKEGIKNIGHSIEIMAEAEELFAHKNAVTLRLNEQ